MFDSIVPPDGGNWGAMVGSQVGFDSTYNGGCCSYWAEGDIARQHECCGVVLVVLFLHFEGDVDAVGMLQGRWVVVAEEVTVFEESKVSDAEDFGSLFFMLLDFDLFTQVHGKERGESWELRDGTLQRREILLCEFGNDASRDYFLLFFFWVFIFVGSELVMSNEAKLEVVVLGWVGLPIFPEGCRNI